MSLLKIVTVCLYLSLLTALSLTGCHKYDTNDTFSIDATAAHTDPTWMLQQHAKYSLLVISDKENCSSCHGGGFEGSATSEVCTPCHTGYQGNTHPFNWGNNEFANHSVYVNENGIANCNTANCHGMVLTGVIGSGPTCSKCHIGGPLQKHPIENMVIWSNPPINPDTLAPNLDSHGVYVQNFGIGTCANARCHGIYLEGVTKSGMSCISCHTMKW